LLTDICNPLIEQNGHPNSRNSSNAHGLPGMKTGVIFIWNKTGRYGGKKKSSNLICSYCSGTWPQNIKSAGCCVSFRRQ